MKFSSKLKWITGLTVFILLSGCNTLAAKNSPSLSNELAEQRTPAEASALGQFLNSAAPQASAVLADTPWGQQLEVSTEAPYYAASGLICRQLRVGEPQQKALVCQQPDGSWTPSRIFN